MNNLYENIKNEIITPWNSNFEIDKDIKLND